MKKLVQTAARMVRCAISNELRKLRRKALEAEIDASFRRLEPRRVLTVNGAFDLGTGVLTVDITAGGNTTGVLQQDGADTTRFFLDENSNGVFDAADEVGGLKADLRGLVVNGPGGVGAFRWLDPNPTGSPVLYNLTSVTIGGVDTAQFQTLANVAANSTISVSNTIAFDAVATGSQLVFAGNLTLNASGPASQIISGANASLTVGGLSDVTATTINLGDAAGDTIHFGSLAFTAAGNVQISEDSSMNLLSSSAAGDVTLSSTGDITIASLSGTDIFVTAAGNILDGDNPDPLVFDPDINASGDVSLTSTNGSIGSSTSNIFTADSISDNPDPLEMTRGPASTLTLNAVNGMIALDAANLGNVTTANTNALWIQSAADVDATNPAIAALIAGKANLALIADVDGDGTGNLTVPNPITVTGDLRLSGADVRVAPVDGTIVANALRFLFDSGESETLRTTVQQLDARSAANLTIIETNVLDLVDLNNDSLNRAVDAGGDLIVRSLSSNLLIVDAANANGNILLQTDGGFSHITIRAPVQSVNGAITVQAQGSITQETNGDLLITTGNVRETNTIYLNAVNGSIRMWDGDTSSTTQGGNIYYRAASSVNVGALNAGNGGIWIDAGTYIVDAQGDFVGPASSTQPGFARPPVTRGVNLIGASAALKAGQFISESSNPLDTNVGTLASISGTNTYIYQTGDLVIGSIDASTVRRVNPDGTTVAVVTTPPTLPTTSLSGVTATNGHAKIETINGNLTVNNSVVANEDILLAAGGTGSNLAINASVSSNTGAITLLAQQDMNQSNQGDVSAANSIYAYAVDGSITMTRNGADQAVSAAPRIYYRAAADIMVGVLDTGTGGIWITAGANIIDGQNDTVEVGPDGFAEETVVGSRVVNLIASTALLRAGGSIGRGVDPGPPTLSGNPLDTSIATLASNSGQNTYIYESNNLAFGSIASGRLPRVDLSSSTTSISTFPPSGATGATGGGDVKIETINGDLAIDTPVNAGSNILLAAGGAGSNLTINAPVNSTNGAITLLAQQNINQNYQGDLTTSGGSIYARAFDGYIAMNRNVADQAVSTSNNGNIYYRAFANVTLGVLNAGNGGIWVDAGANILDGQNDNVGVNPDGFATQIDDLRVVNLIANTAALRAGGSIGVAPNPMDTTVETLASFAGTHIYIYETNDLNIGLVNASSVTGVNLNSTVTAIATDSLSGLQCDGNIKIEAVGSLTVSQSIVAGLNILLATEGANAVLAVNSAVTSTNGAITLLAQFSINQGSNGDLLITTGSGRETNTIYAYAVTGSITMDPNASSITQGGNIYYQAPGSDIPFSGRITIGVLDGGNGGIWIDAGMQIDDAQSDFVGVDANGFATQVGVRVVNLTASNAVLRSGGTIGMISNVMDTDLGTLAIRSEKSAYIYNSGALILVSVAASNVARVNLNSSTTVVPTPALSGVTVADGHAKIETIDGNLTVNAPVTASSDILLAAGGIGSVRVNAPVASTTGNITVSSQRTYEVTNFFSTTQSLYIYSGQDVQWAAGVPTLAVNAPIGIKAERDILLRTVNANSGTGDVVLIAGDNILDAHGDTVGVDGDGFASPTGTTRVVNIFARNAILEADLNLDGSGSIGQAGNPIDTAIDRLASNARTGTYIYESNGLVIGSIVASNITRVHLNSTTILINTTTLAGINNPIVPTLLPTGHVKVETIDGNLTVDAAVFARANTSLPLPGLNTNILLAANRQPLTPEGAAGSLTLNATTINDWGAITLLARQNIAQNFGGGVYISGGTEAESHSIYAHAVEGSISMNRSWGIEAISKTQGGNILYRAGRDVTIGVLDAESTFSSNKGGVWIVAGRNILDGQNDTVGPGNAGFEIPTGDPRVGNILAATAVLQANGSIGVEGNPIEIGVRTVAGTSKDGIFLQGGSVVGWVDASSVKGIHLRSDAADIPANSLSGFVTTTGPIRFLTGRDMFIDGPIIAGGGSADITLIAHAGAIEQRPGTRMILRSNAAIGDTILNVNDPSLFSIGMRIAISDADSPQRVYTVSGVGAGTIQLSSGLTQAIQTETSNLHQVHSLTSSAGLGVTTLNVADSSAFSVGTRVAIWDADSAQRIYTVTAVGPGTIQLSSGLTQAIDAATSQLYPLQAQVVGSNLWLKARDHAHMHDVAVDKLDAQTGANAKLDLHEQVNINASQRGDDFLVDLETRIAGLVISDSVKRTYRFAEHYGDNGYSLYVVNDRTLAVHEVKAGEAGGINSPNVYIETLGTGNIHVNAPVKTFSSNADEGGIILVAGSELKINDSGRLETFQAGGASFDQVVRYTTLDSRFFRLIPTPDMTLTGAPGITTATDTYYTTRSILTTLQSAFATDNFAISGGPKHVYLEAAIQFGRANERGFENFIAYADGLYGMSHAANGTLTGTTALKSLINSTLYANNAVLPSALVSITETGWFVRQDPFNANFIRSDADGVFENFAVMRRANDFFMFQNASNSSGAQDLTVKTEQINVQRDALSPASDPPRSPDAPIVRAVATQVQAKLEEPLVRIDAMTLEFRNVFERQPNILLFRMNEFNDINSNGEPDPEDLPLEDEVLEKVRGNNQARKIAFPNDERGSTKPPVQPTQAEINRVKEALQHDPEAEVGVYSIIKEMPNGEKDVLDIFPIRDPDPLGDSDNLPNEERETIESIPTIPGQKPPGGVNDGAYFLPPRFLKDGGDPSGFSTRDENRGAAMANPTVSLAILLGAIGLRSNRSTTDAAPSATADDVEFARDARRQRRRESLLKTWSESQRRDS